MSKRYKVGETGATALLSSSALMAPCSDQDDGKRVTVYTVLLPLIVILIE